MTKFTKAPLPFIGQKRLFIKHFKQILDDNIPNNGKGWTIVDVFGGSGLLAHTAKHKKPLARVIYNDFDYYSERLKHIKDTNRLRQQIYQIVSKTNKDSKISEDIKFKIINKINSFNGFVDLNCLSAWLLFSGSQVSNFQDLFDKTFYNGVNQNDYADPIGYLDGLEIVRQSFDALLPQFQAQDNVLLILDPPYLCTRQESYKQATYFDLIAFLKLIDLVKPPYIFFSSTKSEFIRFIDYVVTNKKHNWESFNDYKRIIVKTSTSKDGYYEDNLVYKFKS